MFDVSHCPEAASKGDSQWFYIFNTVFKHEDVDSNMEPDRHVIPNVTTGCQQRSDEAEDATIWQTSEDPSGLK